MYGISQFSNLESRKWEIQVCLHGRRESTDVQDGVHTATGFYIDCQDDLERVKHCTHLSNIVAQVLSQEFMLGLFSLDSKSTIPKIETFVTSGAKLTSHIMWSA